MDFSIAHVGMVHCTYTGPVYNTVLYKTASDIRRFEGGLVLYPKQKCIDYIYIYIYIYI